MKTEYRVTYETIIAGLGWRELSDPQNSGWLSKQAAIDAANTMKLQPETYRSIRIEERPEPEPWRECESL